MVDIGVSASPEVVIRHSQCHSYPLCRTNLPEFKLCVDALDTLVADKASDGVKLMALPTTASGHMWPQIDVTSSLG